MLASPPQLVRMVGSGATKSKPISISSAPQGIGDVPSPRADLYSGTCQLWLGHGVSAKPSLPTICVQRLSA